MKCVLISFFNSDNIGDLLISSTLYEFVNEFCDVERISYGSDPYKYSDINNIELTRHIDNGFKYKTKIFLYRILFTLKLEKLIDNFRSISRFEIEVEERISKADFVVIGGGNMIFDVTKYSRSAKYFDRIIEIAKKHNKKIFAISVGIGPFVIQKQEKGAAESLGKCDYITFRDSKSLTLYNKYNDNKKAKQTVDPVFMLKQTVTPILNLKENIIGINLFDNRLAEESFSKYEQVKEGYIRLIKEFLQQPKTRIILFSTDLNDYALINEVSKEIQNNRLEVKCINGINELYSLYGEIKLLVACRMHSLIIAYTQLVPIIGLSWQPKVESFFDIIDQKNSVFPYDSIPDNINNIIELSKLKIENTEYNLKTVEDKLRKIKDAFNVNETILNEIIDDLSIDNLAKENMRPTNYSE